MTILRELLEKHRGGKVEGLVEAIAEAISRGALKPGERLPTQRELARELELSLGTITRAYTLARERGLIHGEVGRGTFVSQPAEDNWRFLPDSHPPVEIDLSVNLPVRCPEVDELAFVEAMQTILAEESGRRLLTTFWPEIAERHREVGVRWCGRTGWEVDPRRVVVGSGFHPTLLAAMHLITRPGDLVLAEELTYPGLKAIARACGVRLKGVAVDEQGLRPDELERACRDATAKILYCRPTHHLATAATLPEERRRRIAEIAIDRGLTVIEEDEEFALLEKPLPPIASFAPEHTIFVAGLNRALALGLATSYAVAPAAMRQGLEGALDEVMWMKAPLLSEIAARWITTDIADELIAARREELRGRQELAARVLAGRVYQSQPLAHHLWLPLPRSWRPSAFITAAIHHGVALAPTEAFFIGPGAVPRAVRVCLGAPPNRKILESGLQRLLDLLDRGPGPVRVVL